MAVIVLVINFHISLLLPHIRDPTTRVVLNTTLGICMSFYTYGMEVFLYIPYSLIGYFCIQLCDRKTCHFYTMALTGVFLTGTNIFEQIVKATGFNVSTLAMITFVKQWQVTINYRDGNGDIDSWLTSREKSFKVIEKPSFMSYCSYMFNL